MERKDKWTIENERSSGKSPPSSAGSSLERCRGNDIAVNKNGSAPIFDAATYGIIGDLFKVGPMLAGVIKAYKAAKV